VNQEEVNVVQAGFGKDGFDLGLGALVADAALGNLGREEDLIPGNAARLADGLGAARLIPI
jgi:hypothetical protein